MSARICDVITRMRKQQHGGLFTKCRSVIEFRNGQAYTAIVEMLFFINNQAEFSFAVNSTLYDHISDALMNIKRK